MACAHRRPQRGSRGKAVRASCVVRARGRARRRSAPENAWQVSVLFERRTEPRSQVSRLREELLAENPRITGELGGHVAASNLGATYSSQMQLHPSATRQATIGRIDGTMTQIVCDDGRMHQPARHTASIGWASSRPRSDQSFDVRQHVSRMAHGRATGNRASVWPSGRGLFDERNTNL